VQRLGKISSKGWIDAARPSRPRSARRLRMKIFPDATNQILSWRGAARLRRGASRTTHGTRAANFFPGSRRLNPRTSYIGREGLASRNGPGGFMRRTGPGSRRPAARDRVPLTEWRNALPPAFAGAKGFSALRYSDPIKETVGRMQSAAFAGAPRSWRNSSLTFRQNW
jgi:hypothetical protein